MLLAKQFGMEYVDANGQKATLLPLLRGALILVVGVGGVPLGEAEGTFVQQAHLLEEYAGALPTWMAPVQVKVLPVTDRAGSSRIWPMTRWASSHCSGVPSYLLLGLAGSHWEKRLRPMTCPFQYQVFLNRGRSYRDLPMRLGETSTLFRNEDSGEMHGLIRVRRRPRPPLPRTPPPDRPESGP